MNELTEKIVVETAKKYKRYAERNDSYFRHLVIVEHWEHCLYTWGWKLKQRSLELFRLWHPECFDGEFIQDYHRIGFDLDMRLSEIACRVIRRKIEREPELQLCFDWGDLPVRTVKPQMEMF